MQQKQKKQIHTLTHLISTARFVELLQLFVQNSSYDAVALYLLRPGSFERLAWSEHFSSQIAHQDTALDLAWESFESGASQDVSQIDVIDMLFGSSHTWSRVTFFTSVWCEDLREGFTIVACAKDSLEGEVTTFGLLELSRLLQLEFEYAALRIECTQVRQDSRM